MMVSFPVIEKESQLSLSWLIVVCIWNHKRDVSQEDNNQVNYNENSKKMLKKIL